MMSEDHKAWPRIKELFSSALALAPHERGQFLREVCGQNTGLRDEVESLLAAHGEAGEFAEHSAFDAAVHEDAADDGDVRPMAKGFEFGPYRIVEPLDAGGMGEVYRAFDTRLQRDVAVKVLPAALTDDPERIARLQREARLLASLNHPHIATIHGLEIAGGLHAVVMELLEGPTLADHLSNGPLPLNAALTVAHQVATALEAAHEKGIIHCDLKPANIKLTARGSAKVLDFGLATTASQGSPDASLDVIAGTPAYMSPEQIHGQRVNPLCDVWAFGCVLYQTLTGRSAFGGFTTAEVITAVLEDAPDWEALPPTVPAGIRRLLRRCLEKDPTRRLHHIADARIEIEDAINAPAGDEATTTGASGSAWNRRLALSIALLALALAAIAGAWFVGSIRQAPELRVVEITTPHTSDHLSFALSTDGRRIAFVSDRDGQPMLWVRALDSSNAEVIPGTEGARRPFWSPDSRSIGFFQNSALKRIDARGGSAQTITASLGGISAAWGPDGTILFAGTDLPVIRRVKATGGTAEPVTVPEPGSTGQAHPQFLPDGKQFLFFAGGPDAVRGVYLASLTSPTITRLLASDTHARYVAPDWLLFVRQGTLLAQRFDIARHSLLGEPVIVADTVAFDPITGTGAFSTSNAGVMAYRSLSSSGARLSWFDRSGSERGTLGSSDQSGLSNPVLSPDGRRVAAQRTIQNETDVWLLDSIRQTRFTRGSAGTTIRLPVWSPVDNQIAFESVQSGSVKLSAKSLTGGGEEVLFESAEVKVPCSYSPDGRFLMYYVPDPKTGTDLWILPTATRKPYSFLKTDANELWGQFSPNGHWVAFQSNETGRYEIYVRPFNGTGPQLPISTAGGVYPRWSRDGKELYYIAPDASMMAVRIRATSTTLDAEAPKALFKTRRLGGGVNVIGNGPQYDVAADGRFLISVDADSGAVPITLLLNWKPSGE